MVRPVLKKCVLCVSEIPVSAMKCTHCSSYQDWRSNLDFGNSTLSLLIAFLSVLGIAVPPVVSAVKSLLYAPRPEFVASAVAITPEKATISVANTGDASGVLNGMICSIYAPKPGVGIKNSSSKLGWDFPKGSEVLPLKTYIYEAPPQIIPPGTQVLATMTFAFNGRSDATDPKVTVPANTEAKSTCVAFHQTREGETLGMNVSLSPLLLLKFRQ
ncbi:MULTISPECIES: hypothetical protein [unclassified Rhizobium]|uniref:hypothetical protein n=1 Tax=unclassified Rhizobium TaxID=2613769 RepID=UPI001ADBD503|nr:MULTISPECIES: hypothetical protein [unclassified Rhizobium]MBO9122213.1 hypothetical protein [Rhizobium sp. 16-488-2b]MBO9172717.1 hypothetical protein [Rhizobium sp. 16-488-2a]